MSNIPVGSVWKRDDGSCAVLLAIHSYKTSFGTSATRFVVLDHCASERAGKVCVLATEYVLENYDRIDQ